MRLWHPNLLPYLDRQRLLSQHRECAAMRGNGWGRKHKTVDYAYNYPYSNLYHYHLLVMNEMEKRGYNVDQTWKDITYRGKVIGYDTTDFTSLQEFRSYAEHNYEYLVECLDLLIIKTSEKPVEVDYVALKNQLI